MCLWKVVIADAMEDFRIPLGEYLQSGFQVRTCADGSEALKLVTEWEPDVLILDLILPELDGVSLLRKIGELPHRPRVLVATALLSDYVRYALEELGVQYAMLKPCPLRTVADRVRELTDQLAPSPTLQARYLHAAADTLMELGLPNRRLGFQHLLTGLPLLMLQRDQRLSKELYDTIAQSCGSTAPGVEKAIREVIHAGWDTRDEEIWHKYFPGSKGCPKNKEFLFRLTDLLMQKVG